MKTLKLRERLNKRGLMLLSHGKGWLVTNMSVKHLFEKTFATLDEVSAWLDSLPNRLTDFESKVWDEEFEKFVEKENA